MGKIHLISSSQVSRKVVHKILCSEHQVLSLSCKQTILDSPGELVLLTIGSSDGHVYIFDVKTCKDILTEGELWRILQSIDIVKVTHDCRQASAALKKHFSVTLRNVFDTQAAYCMVMMLRSLPPRFIHPHHLYEKFGDPSQSLEADIEASVEEGGIFWAQRPLSNAMLRSAATDALILHPAVYENLKKELSPAHDDVLAELCEAYVRGKFKTKQRLTGQSTAKHERPILRLTESQQYLLSNTVPQSAGALTYAK